MPGRWSIECVASSEVTTVAGVSAELCSTVPELLLVMIVVVLCHKMILVRQVTLVILLHLSVVLQHFLSIIPIPVRPDVSISS